MQTRVRWDLFGQNETYVRGKPKWFEAIWYLIKCLFFLSPLPWPSLFKAQILRWFGAKIGKGVTLKPRINIHLPWHLEIGDYTQIGEEVFLLNFLKIKIGSHCCISQRAFLCTGNHDYMDPKMPFRHAEIHIRDGAWIGAQVFVAPGVSVGVDAVVSAGSVVKKSLPDNQICDGNPCRPIKPRWND